MRRLEERREASPLGRSVLAIDDDPTFRSLIRSYLTPGGYSVTEAADGEEAIVLCQTRCFDIVLCDLEMPVMDGIAFTRAARALSGDWSLVPIVIISGHAREADVHRGSHAGADQYLLKPTSMKVLLSTVSHRLAQAAAVRAVVEGKLVQLYMAIKRQEERAQRVEDGW